MSKTDNRQFPIERVGASRRSSLRLRGTVLELTESGWTGQATTLIPVEWVTVTREEHRPNLPVVRLACAAAGALMLILVGLGAVYTSSGGAPDFLPTMLQAVFFPMVWLVIVAIGAGIAWCVMSAVVVIAKPRPTVAIYVEAEPEPWRVEFWHSAADNPELEAMVARLEVAQREADRDDTPPPLQTTYSTYRIYPIRIVVMKTIGITLLIAAPVVAIAWYFGQPLVLAMLVAPAVVYFGRLGISALFWRRAPFVYREAVRRFESGRYDEAHRLISKVLDDFPDALPAHLLSVQIDLRRGQFDRAMRGCHDVSRFDEEAGQELLEEVWTVKRLNDRMDVEL